MVLVACKAVMNLFSENKTFSPISYVISQVSEREQTGSQLSFPLFFSFLGTVNILYF